MKEFLLAGVFAAAFTVAIASQSGTAFATESDQVALCAAALDAQGLAAADEYRAKFLKTKGGAVKTVTVKLIPVADGVEAIEAECEIKRGEVTNATVKA
jgi:ABC-type glycerol-3-phosphate transport system substrate-binding protein